MAHEVDGLEEERRYLVRQIQELQRAYQAAAQPFADRLVALEGLRMPSYMVRVADLDPEMLKQLTK